MLEEYHAAMITRVIIDVGDDAMVVNGLMLLVL